MTILLNQTMEGAEETLGTLFACSNVSGEQSPTYALCEMGIVTPAEALQYLRWLELLGPSSERRVAGIAHALSSPDITDLYIRGYVWFESYPPGSYGCLGVWRDGQVNSHIGTQGFILGRPKDSDHRIFIGSKAGAGGHTVRAFGPEVVLAQWYLVDIHLNTSITTLALDGVPVATYTGNLVPTGGIDAIWTGMSTEVYGIAYPVRFDHLQASTTPILILPTGVAFKLNLT